MLRAWALRPNAHFSAASPLFLFFASAASPSPPLPPSPPSSLASPSPNRRAMSRPLRIAVVGDVHDQWDLEQDSRALEFLQADLVLFTGDFGNENVELVRSISNLKLPKAVILGNHDSWTTQTFSEKKTNRVCLQLECLGEEHVGYSRLDFPTLKLCVLGGRPFSCGGDKFFRPRLLSSRYGVNNMEESAKKICKAARGIPEGHCVIILAHNGPTGLDSDATFRLRFVGLGSNADDICGRDWIYGGGGDYGDPDLARAISVLQRDEQIPIPLVVFGHMHNALRYGNGLRKMIVVASDNTIYLNGAIVPRVKDSLLADPGSSTEGMTDPGSSAEDQNQLQTSGVSTLRAFTVVEMLNGEVEKIAETWVLVSDSNVEIGQENILFQKR